MPERRVFGISILELRAMLKIALPLAIAELGWMAMGVEDTIMVGRLPSSAVAIGASSIGNAAFYGLAIFGLGLFAGLDSVVSRAFGADDWPAARRGLASGLVLALLSAPVLIAGIFGILPLFGAIGVPVALREQAASFTKVLVWSLPLLLLYSVFRRYLQGIHYVRLIPFILFSANAVNIFGNWVLIFGRLGFPALGVPGSALSTVFARIYLVIALFLAIRHRDPAAFRALRTTRAEVAAIFRIGLPAALTIGFEVGVFNLASALAATLGAVSSAANAIALNVASVTYMVPLGIGAAAAASVGRAIGAGDIPGAKRAGWHAIIIGAIYELFAAAVLFAVPRAIAGIYTVDPAVIRLTVVLLGIAAVFQLFDGLQTVASGALRGAGSTRLPMIWNLVGYYVFGLPVGYWFCYRAGQGVVGLWYGLSLGLIIIAIALVRVWARWDSSATGPA